MLSWRASESFSPLRPLESLAAIRRRIIEHLDRHRGYCQHCKRSYDQPSRPPPDPPDQSDSSTVIEWLVDRSGLRWAYEKVIK